MTSPVTAHDMLDQLRQSQLLTPAQADGIRARFDSDASPRAVADILIDRGWLTPFQAEEATRGNVPELVLGPYRLLDMIGMGGMGGVFKALDSRLKRIVALKMIRQELVQNTDYVRRFHREAETAAQLMHPNVVVIYDVGEANGNHYLAMEFVEGTDLAKIVQLQGVQPVPMACDYIRQAALGLQHAHERGVIHRDIKPSNLLVARPTSAGLRSGPIRSPSLSALRGTGAGWGADSPTTSAAMRSGSGIVKILDMGLARLVDSDDRSALTQTGSVIGTPDFIAPEQAINASSVDHRADIYSLGCTFYYLLTGQPPYGEGTPAEKLQKHVNEKFTPKPIEEIRRNLAPEVASILYRMMAKNRDSRYQSAQEVADDLAATQRRPAPAPAPHAGAAPDSQHTPPPVAPGDETVRSKAADTPPQPTYAMGLDTVVLPARRSAALGGHKGYVTALTFSADGRMLASAGVDETLRLWDLGPMFDQDGGRPSELAILRGQLGEVQTLAFSPGGTSLVTGSANSQRGPMWWWDWQQTEATRARIQVPSQPILIDALAFSRDGLRFAGTVHGAVFVWAIGKKGLTRESVLRGHGTSSRAIAFHPDGKRLALGGDDTTVRVYEFGWLRNTAKPPMKGHTDAITSLTYSPTGSLIATGSKDGTVRLWDGTGADPNPKAVFTGHNAAVRLVRFTPRGTQLVSAGDGGEVNLWDITTNAPVREWSIDKTLAHSVAFSPDGRYLAVGTAAGGEGLVSLYDLELIMVEQLAPTAAGI